MNRKALHIFLVFILLTGATAGLLARVRNSYTLGKPGVKLGNTPLYSESNLVATISVDLPAEIANCKSTVLDVDRTELAMLPPDTVYGRRTYHGANGFRITASAVLMGTDRTSIHKPQYCLVGQGWKIEHSEVITIPISEPYPYDLNVMKLSLSNLYRNSDGQFVPLKGYYLYWFVADGQLTPHHTERMWWMARDLVTKGILQRWAYVAMLSYCLPGQETELLERMKAFISESVPKFQITAGPAKLSSAAPATATLDLANVSSSSIIPFPEPSRF